MFSMLGMLPEVNGGGPMRGLPCIMFIMFTGEPIMWGGGGDPMPGEPIMLGCGIIPAGIMPPMSSGCTMPGCMPTGGSGKSICWIFLRLASCSSRRWRCSGVRFSFGTLLWSKFEWGKFARA